MPNAWKTFTAHDIATSAAVRYPKIQNSTTCLSKGFTCSEYDWAFFFSTQYEVSPHLILKFLPAQIIFYVCVLLMALGGMVVRAHPKVQRVLRTMWKCENSIGEWVCFGLFLIAISLWCVSYFHDHNFSSSHPTPPQHLDNEWYANQIARGLGQVSVFVLSMLLFPAARNSIFGVVFDVPWELHIKYHRYLGILFLFASFSHMTAFYSYYYYAGVLPNNMFHVPSLKPLTVTNFTAQHISLTMWTCFILFSFSMYEPIRRKFFELFYYTHIAGFVIMIPAVLWHAPTGWKFMLPGLALWFIDRCCRLYRSAQRVEDVQLLNIPCAGAGNIVEVVCTSPFRYYAGQYCFLNVAEVSLLEWHPFTISSSDPRKIMLHIKECGPGTWTGNLFQAIGRGDKLTVSLDGPYGSAINYFEFKTVVLVAAGIGFAPVKSIFEALVSHQAQVTNVRSVHVIWVSRDASLFSLMQSEPVSKGSQMYHVHLYVSGVPTSGEMHLGMIPIHHGRPDFKALFADIVDDGLPHETITFVCAPKAIEDTCLEIANERKCTFHTETFNW